MPPTSGMNSLNCVFVLLQLKIRDAIENERVRLKNQVMFAAILPHCGSRSELIREMARCLFNQSIGGTRPRV
jgi:hypothetical protein